MNRFHNVPDRFASERSWVRIHSGPPRQSKLHIACSDFCQNQSALIPLLFLSKPNPLRWAVVWRFLGQGFTAFCCFRELFRHFSFFRIFLRNGKNQHNFLLLKNPRIPVQVPEHLSCTPLSRVPPFFYISHKITAVTRKKPVPN